MEAGKRRLTGDTMREASTTTEVQELKGENRSLKELVAELSLRRYRDVEKKRKWRRLRKAEVYALQSTVRLQRKLNFWGQKLRESSC